MRAALLLRRVVDRSGRSLRRLAATAGTSHATLSAYGHGRVDPAVGTVERVARAAGLAVEATVVGRRSGADRGQELLDVLELAAQFPARHASTLDAPVFGRRTDR